jgi:hypothetical protein
VHRYTRPPKSISQRIREATAAPHAETEQGERAGESPPAPPLLPTWYVVADPLAAFPIDVRAMDFSRKYADTIRITTTDPTPLFPFAPVDPVVQNLSGDFSAIEIVFTVTSRWGSGIRIGSNRQWSVGGITEIDPTIQLNPPTANVRTVSGSVTAADVTDRSARLLGVIASIAATVTADVTDRAGRALGVIASITAAVDISDRAGRALGVIASITAAVDISDRAARLVGIVSGSVGQIAQKAASVVALATDTSVVVQLSPMDATAATLGVTATGAVNTAVTATLPAAGAGLFHYIVSIEIVKLYSVIGVAAGAGVLITSTNLPGNPVWTTEQLASAAGTATKVVQDQPAHPIKSAVANTATTIVAPLQLQTIWRINVRYYVAP